MAILRSIDGKFYEIEDDDLSNFELDADRVKEVIAEIGDKQPESAGPIGDFSEIGEPPQVMIQVLIAEVCWDTAASSRRHQTESKPSPWFAGSGYSRTCWERRPIHRRPTSIQSNLTRVASQPFAN